MRTECERCLDYLEKRRPSDPISGHPHVYLQRNGRWTTYIRRDNRVLRGGTFERVEDAAEAARRLCAEYPVGAGMARKAGAV